MRAVRCLRHGALEDLVVEEVPAPVPGDGEVVVDVASAALNFPDALIVANEYQISVPTPFTPGSEFAGVVSAVGAGVTEFEVGDRVVGTTMVGAFAEQVVTAAMSVRPIPPGVSFDAAAAFGVAHATAFHSLRSVANLQAGEWVLVLGAAGGVGLATVEIAAALGARVVAAASSDDKLVQCREKGAVATVNYATDDLRARVKEHTDGGVDVVIDPVGGPHAEAALRATRWGARYVVVGFASGEIPRIPLNLVLLKGVSIMGFEFGGFVRNEADRFARGQEELYALQAKGALQPLVSARYSLDDAPAALRAMRDRAVVGKIVVRPNGDRPNQDGTEE
jgi:NADPH2:quinone reductase